MSNGLGHVLPNIFSDGQTFCIVGKDIAETLASIRDMTDIDEMKGYILKIIWYRVRHENFLSVLKVLGIEDYLRKWVKIFYRGIYSSVIGNGHLTKKFQS